MTDIPEDIHDIADDIWILMAANTCGRTELTEIIARAILAERVHAESKLAEARADALEEAAKDVVERFIPLCFDGTIGRRSIKGEKQALLRDVARAIRALKSGGAND